MPHRNIADEVTRAIENSNRFDEKMKRSAACIRTNRRSMDGFFIVDLDSLCKIIKFAKESSEMAIDIGRRVATDSMMILPENIKTRIPGAIMIARREITIRESIMINEFVSVLS